MGKPTDEDEDGDTDALDLVSLGAGGRARVLDRNTSGGALDLDLGRAGEIVFNDVGAELFSVARDESGIADSAALDLDLGRVVDTAVTVVGRDEVVDVDGPDPVLVEDVVRIDDWIAKDLARDLDLGSGGTEGDEVDCLDPTFVDTDV